MERTLQETEMSDAEDSEQKRVAEDKEVKIIDLEQHDPMAERKHLQLTAAVLGWQRSPQRRHWRVMCTMSLLLLLVVLLSISNVFPSVIIESFKRAYAPQAHPSHTGSSLPVLPQRDGITCLRDAIWSPDSKFIAVLGYSQTCSYVAYVPGLVNLYEAQTSKLLRQLHPDDMIVQALHKPVASSRQAVASVPPDKKGGGSQPVISYTHVVWSPDTQRLAFTFHLAASSPSLNGIVLMNTDGTRTEVLLNPQNPLAPSSAEWDLERKVPITSQTFPLPPALTYHWGPKGTLIPERLLPSGALPVAPPLVPIGNPDGDPSFTLWQPGLIHETVVYASHAFTTHSWSTSFAAWSADGRFLITDLSFWGALDSAESIAAGNQFVMVSSLGQAAHVSRRETASPKDIATTRDSSSFVVAGLTNQCAALLQAVDTPLAFAWSPNGRVLADYGDGNRVDLYECPTGHKLTSFTLQSKYAASSADAVVLRWSPDGLHLLLSSVAFGLVSLWKFDSPQ